MRMNTRMALGVRNVGDRLDEGTIWDGEMMELLERLIGWLGKTTCRKRIEIVIAPEVRYVEDRITSTKISKSLDDEEAMDAVRLMMARADSGEALLTTDPEDDYVPSYDSQAAAGRDEG